MHVLDAYLERHRDLTREEADRVRMMGKDLVLRPGFTLCQVGQAGCGCGLVLAGIIQVYGVSPRGRETVLDLVFPGMTVLLPGALAPSPGPAGRSYIGVVTTCTLRVWPGQPRHPAHDQHPELQRFRLKVIEDALRHWEQRCRTACLRSAEQRYARMVDELPTDWLRVPQHLIASYLGITLRRLSGLKRQAADPTPARNKDGHGGTT